MGPREWERERVGTLMFLCAFCFFLFVSILVSCLLLSSDIISVDVVSSLGAVSVWNLEMRDFENY